MQERFQSPLACIFGGASAIRYGTNEVRILMTAIGLKFKTLAVIKVFGKAQLRGKGRTTKKEHANWFKSLDPLALLHSQL